MAISRRNMLTVGAAGWPEPWPTRRERWPRTRPTWVSRPRTRGYDVVIAWFTGGIAMAPAARIGFTDNAGRGLVFREVARRVGDRPERGDDPRRGRRHHRRPRRPPPATRSPEPG